MMHSLTFGKNQFLVSPNGATHRKLGIGTTLGIAALFLAKSALASGVPANQAPKTDLFEKVCTRPAPVLVLDNHPPAPGEETFTAKSIDVNGDTVSDVFHGDLIRKQYEANGKQTLAMNLSGDGSVEQVAEKITHIVEQIRSGTLSISGVNFSQTLDLPFSIFNNGFLPTKLTPENLANHRQDILDTIFKLAPDGFPAEDFKTLVEQFKALDELGVPILVVAGNKGPEVFNFYSLLPGAVTVGALGTDGKKLPSSADHSLVQLWLPGEVVFREVEGGIDLNGDTQAEFPPENIAPSAKRQVVKEYAGRSIPEVFQTIPKEWELLKTLKTDPAKRYVLVQNEFKEGIYDTGELGEVLSRPESGIATMKSRGPFAHVSGQFIFTEQAGKLVFDPARTGDKSQIGMTSGTSFAPPALCKPKT